jgi:protein ImuB
VLSDLVCEIARSEKLVDDGPFAVIVDDEEVDGELANAVLDAVDHKAWQYGARPGQTSAQASAFVGKLRVVRLTRVQVMSALGCVAEMSLGFGTTAALELREVRGQETLNSSKRAAKRSFARYPGGAGAGPYDTVWLDVTGCSRLVGGDDLLCADLRERTAALGHRARVAIASGPRIARAIARWASPRSALYAGARELVVPRDAGGSEHGAEHLAKLPITALPLPADIGSWLLKLGLLCIEDLAKLDRKRLSHRLGARSRDLLELIAGRDDVPLLVYAPARNIIESATFEQELSGSVPLLFVLGGLTSRAIARLSARGEACSLACIRLTFDRSVIALENRTRKKTNTLPNQTSIDLELPVPLAREEELIRALRAKVERLELPAPIVAVTLILDGLTSKEQHQLNLGRRRNADPNALPMLLAELSAHIGPQRVGTLSIIDSHRPESQSRLTPVDWSRSRSADSSSADSSKRLTYDRLDSILNPKPTRILPRPIDIGKLTIGGLVSAAQSVHGLFIVDRLRLSARIDRVEWWSSSPVSRDYARAWLHTNLRSKKPHVADQPEYGEAWMYVDRTTRRGFLHGWYE